MKRRHPTRVGPQFAVILAACSWVAPLDTWATKKDMEVALTIRPEAISLGQKVYAQYTITDAANPPPPPVPEIADARVNPNPSVSRNQHIFNNTITRSVVYTYEIIPTREGTFTVGPVQYIVNGKQHLFPDATFQVGPRVLTSEQGRKRLEDILFARLSIDDKMLYVQENAEVILSVYSHGLTLMDDFQLSGLPTSGLNFREFRGLEGKQEIIDGTVYRVHQFRAHFRGLTAGTFTVKPVLSVSVHKKTRRNKRNIFDDFFRLSSANAERINIQTKPLVLTIQALPTEGKPPGFSGAVGDFTFELEAKPRQLTMGDPITLTTRITGNGNIDTVPAPELNLGPNFKQYEAQLLEKDIHESRSSGWKIFEQVAIPMDGSIAEIPRVTFSYFHPGEERYRSIGRGPYQLELQPNKQPKPRVVQSTSSSGNTNTVRVLDDDIMYLKPSPGSWRSTQSPPWYKHRIFLGSQAAPPTIALLAIGILRRRQKLQGDQALSRRRRSQKTASTGIRQIHKALNEKNKPDFFEAFWNTLASYFGDRLNLAPGEISQERVVKVFSQSGMKGDDIAQIQEVFELCEQARFGLGHDATRRMTESDQQNATVMVEKLELVVKRCETIRV